MKRLSQTDCRRLVMARAYALTALALAVLGSLASVAVVAAWPPAGQVTFWIWSVLIAITFVAAPINIVAVVKLRARRPVTVSRREADFEFFFLVREQTILKFVETLNRVADDELRGLRFQWNRDAAILHCELAPGVIRRDATAFVRGHRPLTARPMHLLPVG